MRKAVIAGILCFSLVFGTYGACLAIQTSSVFAVRDTETVVLPGKNNTSIIAHRGRGGTENTREAFEFAAARSYYGIETDIWATIDGQYICSHDNSLKRVFGVDLSINNSTYSEIKEISQSIPTLQEFLDICRNGGKVAVVELKQIFTKEQTEEILRICDGYDVIFISFSKYNLQLLRFCGFTGAVQYLVSNEITNQIMLECIDLKADLSASYIRLSKLIIRKFHFNGIKVAAWTVNNIYKAREVLALDIDYLVTDIFE